MTAKEAIETLRANYPDACYEQLREAVDAAIEALKARDTAGDTISRQAAIDVLHGYFDGMLETDTWSPCDVYGLIKILPSAQPSYNPDEWCHDCKEYDQERHSCPRWNRVIRKTVDELRAEQAERREE